MYQRNSADNVQVTFCGVDGNWTPSPEECSVTCGEVTQNLTKCPWNAKIYHEPTDTHSLGTIINARTILSVEVEFWNRIKQTTNDLSKYIVWIERRNIIHQHIELERIAYAPNHNKFTSTQSGNIAVLVLRTSIEFKSAVVPICLPLDLYADGTPSSFKGRTPQQEDVELKLPTDCYSEWNSTHKPLATIDVLCTSRLKLDPYDLILGSSFAVSIAENSSEIFYLLGIRTWYEIRDGQGTYFTFQNVLFYKEFIQKETSYENQKDSKGIDSTYTSFSVDKKFYWKPPPEESCGIVKQNVTKTPWNAMLYHEATDLHSFVTIISPRIVLSVEIVFWNRTEQKTNDLSKFIVVIVRESIIYQHIELERIAYAPNHNKFISTPSGCIVILVLLTSIEFNSAVTPICLPFELYPDAVTPSSFNGRIPQQEDVELKLPTNCYSEWKSTGKPLAAIDVLCTSRLKLDPNDLILGSSFAVSIAQNSSEIFYLLGMRTYYNIPDGQGTYFTFQNVLFYKDFIQSEIFYENEKYSKGTDFTNTSSVDKVFYWTPPPEESCEIVKQNVTKTPWNAMLYHEATDSHSFVTIIGPRIVLSVEIVFWNRNEQKTTDLSKFIVWIVRESIIYQYIELERIAYAPNHNKFISTPSGYIAVLVLRTNIEFKSAVVPICLPFDLYADGTPSSFKGRTPQLENVKLKLPTNCYSEWNSTGKPLPAIDVLCTSRLKLDPNDLILGSSFAVSIAQNSSEIFYLLGIRTSHDIPDGQGTYFTFQNILFYKDFIQKEISYENEKDSKKNNSTTSTLLLGEIVSWTPPPEETSTTTCGIVTQSITKTPWNVKIVHNTTSGYSFGTIINVRMVLTHAIKLWNPDNHKRQKLSEYYVEIARRNIRQQIELERIAFAPNHRKFLDTQSGSIAVIVLRTRIEFTAAVLPICLRFELYVDGATPSSFKGRTPQQDNIELKFPTNCFLQSNSTDITTIAIDELCTNKMKWSPSEISLGSSFALAIEKNGNEVYYLLGISTWWHQHDHDELYLVFQNVLFLEEFIQSEICYENEMDCKGANTTTSYSSDGKFTYCLADNIPNRGHAYYESNDQKIEFGEKIQNFATILYRCIENHVLDGKSINICENGKWMFPDPECKPRCNPNEIQGWSLVANCQFREDNTLRQTSCTEPAEPRTVAVINCQRGYERFGSYQQIARCGLDGRWSPLPEKCTPICGIVSRGVAYMSGGEISDVSNVPWHAGIYFGSKQVCGGSIITAKVVISAMHCFWDPSTDRSRNMEDYRVAVGKSRRQLDELEQSILKPQFFKIENVFYEEGYYDYAGNYANDIAVVILDNFIEFKSYIVPVCIKFGLEYDDKLVQTGLMGKVAGWGYDQTGTPSPVIKVIELPVISRKECIQNSFWPFRPFITSDKFCAGYLKGIGVCQGDSGGGFVIPETKGIKTVFFLRGIVSTGNLQTTCEKNKYTTFTNVAYFEDLIKKYYSEYQPNL